MLAELVKAEPGRHPVAKAICLPNEAIPEGQATFRGLPREVFLDGRDLTQIESVFGRYFGGVRPGGIDRHRRAFLKACGKGLGCEDLRQFISHNEILFHRRFERGRRTVKLGPGDWLEIPPHCRHRVDATSETQDTVWLAVHWY